MIPTKIRLAACSASRSPPAATRPPRSAEIDEALPNLPLPPQAELRRPRPAGRTRSRSPCGRRPAPDAVAAYYRGVFKRAGWKLVNDAKDAEGAIVLLAEQKGPPLWVRIRARADGGGTLVELVGGGGEQDSTARARAPAS